MKRAELLGEEIRGAATSYLRGHDSQVEEHLRRALAICEGKRRGLT